MRKLKAIIALLGLAGLCAACTKPGADPAGATPLQANPVVSASPDPCKQGGLRAFVARDSQPNISIIRFGLGDQDVVLRAVPTGATSAGADNGVPLDLTICRDIPIRVEWTFTGSSAFCLPFGEVGSFSTHLSCFREGTLVPVANHNGKQSIPLAIRVDP